MTSRQDLEVGSVPFPFVFPSQPRHLQTFARRIGVLWSRLSGKSRPSNGSNKISVICKFPRDVPNYVGSRKESRRLFVYSCIHTSNTRITRRELKSRFFPNTRIIGLNRNSNDRRSTVSKGLQFAPNSKLQRSKISNTILMKNTMKSKVQRVGKKATHYRHRPWREWIND